MLMLPLEQRLLARDAPLISTYRPILPDYTVARDDNGDMVIGDGTCNGPCGFGLSHRFGDFAVTAGFTGGDLAQRLPNTLLEGRTPNIQWEFDVRFLPLNITENAR